MRQQGFEGTLTGLAIVTEVVDYVACIVGSPVRRVDAGHLQHVVTPCWLRLVVFAVGCGCIETT